MKLTWHTGMQILLRISGRVLMLIWVNHANLEYKKNQSNNLLIEDKTGSECNLSNTEHMLKVWTLLCI